MDFWDGEHAYCMAAKAYCTPAEAYLKDLYEQQLMGINSDINNAIKQF